MPMFLSSERRELPFVIKWCAFMAKLCLPGLWLLLFGSVPASASIIQSDGAPIEIVTVEQSPPVINVPPGGFQADFTVLLRVSIKNVSSVVVSLDYVTSWYDADVFFNDFLGTCSGDINLPGGLAPGATTGLTNILCTLSKDSLNAAIDFEPLNPFPQLELFSTGSISYHQLQPPSQSGAVPYTTLPEPSTLALIGAGILGFAAFRHKNRILWV
jgi:PEP-CTERM motif